MSAMPRPLYGNPLRRVLRSSQPDHEYASECEANEIRYKEALTHIQTLFMSQYVDGKTIKEIVDTALQPF